MRKLARGITQPRTSLFEALRKCYSPPCAGIELHAASKVQIYIDSAARVGPAPEFTHQVRSGSRNPQREIMLPEPKNGYHFRNLPLPGLHVYTSIKATAELGVMKSSTLPEVNQDAVLCSSTVQIDMSKKSKDRLRDPAL